MTLNALVVPTQVKIGVSALEFNEDFVYFRQNIQLGRPDFEKEVYILLIPHPDSGS